MVSKAAQELIAEGRKEGIVIGEASGFEKGEASGLRKAAVTGEAELLVRFLELRFGELPERHRIRVGHASLSEIEGWTERFFAAESLADLFDEPP